MSVSQVSRTSAGSELSSRLLVPLLVVLIFVGILDSVQAYYIFFNGVHSAANFVRFLVSNLYYCLYFLLPAFTVKWLSARVSLQRGSLFLWLIVHLSALIALTVVHQTTALEIDKLVLGSRQAETLFSVLFNNPGVWGDIVVYVLFLLGFHMFEYRSRNQRNEMEYLQVETELAQARLSELRSRIHPQFLFAALDAMTELVRKRRWKEANSVLSSLSEFLRDTVYGNDRAERTLDEEIGFLDRYLAIEQLRFRKRLDISREIDEHARKALLPGFIVQPVMEQLVRNCLDYSKSRCEIQITGRQKGTNLELILRIRKNGEVPDLPPATSKDSVINITRERLEHLYGPGKDYCTVTALDGSKVVSFVVPFRLRSEEKAFTRTEKR